MALVIVTMMTHMKCLPGVAIGSRAARLYDSAHDVRAAEVNLGSRRAA